MSYKPSDQVMVEFGARQRFNDDTGETKVYEKTKQMSVAYAYYLELTKQSEYNKETGFHRGIGRTIKLVGQAAVKMAVEPSVGKVEVASLAAPTAGTQKPSGAATPPKPRGRNAGKNQKTEPNDGQPQE